MQKFGLITNQSKLHSALEAELVREQASALGRAGKQLRLALEAYQASQENGQKQYQTGLLIDNISEATWALVLQREFLGFIDGNLDWIQKHYHIPERALNRLGQSTSTSC